MKKLILGIILTGVVLGLIAIAKPAEAKKGDVCTTIQDGTLKDSAENIIPVGFNNWGYNYQGHFFNGMYCDAYRDAAWCQPYKDIKLLMKWNDAWLSNKDCGTQVNQAEYTDLELPDGTLDRHYPTNSYLGSGAWVTNHQSGEYEGEGGEICKWNYFVKIVAAPEDAYAVNGIWYTADGVEIGPVIWGSFAIIQQVENDECAELHGLQVISPARAGLGNW